MSVRRVLVDFIDMTKNSFLMSQVHFIYQLSKCMFRTFMNYLNEKFSCLIFRFYNLVYSFIEL